MNKEDKEWLQKCLDDPKRYKIYVDNDDIFVVEVTEEGIAELAVLGVQTQHARTHHRHEGKSCGR